MHFKSMTEFSSWKEMEEEAAYTTYVKTEQTYKTSVSGNSKYLLANIHHKYTDIAACYYFISCRSWETSCEYIG